jgi:hypothetical protein
MPVNIRGGKRLTIIVNPINKWRVSKINRNAFRREYPLNHEKCRYLVLLTNKRRSSASSQKNKERIAELFLQLSTQN